MTRQPESDLRTLSRSPNGDDSVPAEDASVKLREGLEKLASARERMLTAAIAYCDGMISGGQLKAVRELLREQERRVDSLENRALGSSRPALQEPESEVQTPRAAPPPAPKITVEPEPEPKPLKPSQAAEPLPTNVTGDLLLKLERLESKLSQLERSLESGQVNQSQFEAIRKHYQDQREIALRLHEVNPESDRWRTVLEEGKTSYLLQHNEAACTGIALYHLKSREKLLAQGKLPPMAEEAVTFLNTFGPKDGDQSRRKMYATHTDDGKTLMLIPGRFTAALIVFSDDPPSWQVRALSEVQSNFEVVNRAALERGERKALVYPSLSQFIRT